MRIFPLHVDCVDEDIKNIFDGLAHSIKCFFEYTDEEGPVCLRGQRTDSGGGAGHSMH